MLIDFSDDETTKKTTTTSIPKPKIENDKDQPVSSNQNLQLNKENDKATIEVKKDPEKPHVQIPRVRSSRQSESIAETTHVKSTNEAPHHPENQAGAEQEKPKDIPKEQPKVNPLLWQLHKKKMDGGTIQLGHLLDQHRYLMMENSTDPIPKVIIEFIFRPLTILFLFSNIWKIQNKEILTIGSRQRLIALERIWLFL